MFADIVECDFSNGGCNQKCMNTDGSFYCICQDDGFTLLSNQRTCVGKILRLIRSS